MNTIIDVKSLGETTSLAAASKPTLASQARSAHDAFTRLDNFVARTLNGQASVSRQALRLGYQFACACVANPDEAAKLPEWDQGAVREGTNSYYQPLKYVAGDVSREITSKLTMWAAIYRDASENSIPADEFLDVLKRNHGVRAWYDSLRTAANDNEPMQPGEAIVATVAFGQPANDNRPEEPEGPEPVTPVAVAPLPEPGTTVVAEPPSTVAAPPEAEPQFVLVLLDLATVEADVLTTIEQGGYRGLVRLQGITGPAIVRLLNDHGLDARVIRGVAR